MSAANANGPTRPHRTARRRAKPRRLRAAIVRRAAGGASAPDERIDSSSSSTAFDSRSDCASGTSARSDERTRCAQSAAAPPADATFARASKGVSPDSRQSASVSRSAGSDEIMTASSRVVGAECTRQAVIPRMGASFAGSARQTAEGRIASCSAAGRLRDRSPPQIKDRVPASGAREVPRREA